MVGVIAFLVLILVVYLLAAFMTLEVNPIRWPIDTRIATTVAWAFLLIFLAAYVVHRFEIPTAADIEKSAMFYRAMERLR